MIKRGYQAPKEPTIRQTKPTPVAWVWECDKHGNLKGSGSNHWPAVSFPPPNADMLRYDLAFCNPEAPDEVIFPVFKTSQGHTTRSITLDRWRSFGLSLDRSGMHAMDNDLKQWVTYITDTSGDLLPVKLGDWIERHKAKVVAWR